MLALLIANFGTTIAEFVGVAAAFGLAGVPSWLCVPPVAAGVWLLVTRGSYKRVERVFLAMTAVYAAYVIAGVLAARLDPGGARRGRPAGPSASLWLLTASRHRYDHHALGSVLHPGVHRRQAHLDPRVRLHQGRGLRGAVFTNAIDLFIVVACAATLYREGVAVDAARGRGQGAGARGRRLAELLFGFGLLNVSILGAAILPLTTAYAVCEAFGFESGLDKGASEAPAFHGLLTRSSSYRRWSLSSRACRSSRSCCSART